MIKNSNEENFIIFNPDTIWSLNYLKVINEMEDFYFSEGVENILLVVEKNLSFDKNFKGDFNLTKNLLQKESINNYIYTGCQIINKNLFKDIKDLSFSMSKVWKILLDKNLLYGVESEQEFIHLTDLEIYNDLSKNN